MTNTPLNKSESIASQSTLTDSQLQLSCHTHLSGHRPISPADNFSAMAKWCEENGVTHDTYGSGKLIQDFEKKIADRLGFESALFCITGTMAQATALRIACAKGGSPLVAVHPTSHILLHEDSNYQLLNSFKTIQIGSPFRTLSVDDLRSVPDKLGAAVLEIPMREIGGQCLAWDELTAFKNYCNDGEIHLHMDGARLWEVVAAYGRSEKEIAEGFNSVYVSLYKGMHGMGGAMLLGKTNFIAEARKWTSRYGGSVYHRTPYVVSAAMQFDSRIAAMPDCYRRTVWLYEVLKDYPLIVPNPSVPQANMLHLHMPVSRERAIHIRNRIAAQHGVWLFGGVRHAALPNHCSIELYVGDNLVNMPDQRLREILNLWCDKLTEEAETDSTYVNADI